MTDQPETGTPTTTPPTPQPDPAPAPEYDPAEVNAAAEILAARTEANHRAAELAAYRAAAAAGADADALLDSRAFVKKVRELDPADTGFADKVKAIITARQGNAAVTDTTTTPDKGTATTDTTPANGQDPTAPDTGAKDWKAEYEKAAADAEKWKHFSRQHEDTSKATKKQLDEQERVLKLLAEKAGIELEQGPPDPDKLAKELTAAQEAARLRAVELAVYRAAAKHDADVDALLDSRVFADKVKDLDPDAGDFADKVSEAIAAAVEANPRYKATTPAGDGDPEPVKDEESGAEGGDGKATEPAKERPKARIPRSGGEFGGTPGGNRQWTEQDVAAASPQEVTAAIDAGLLQNLGFGPGKKRR